MRDLGDVQQAIEVWPNVHKGAIRLDCGDCALYHIAHLKGEVSQTSTQSSAKYSPARLGYQEYSTDAGIRS